VPRNLDIVTGKPKACRYFDAAVGDPVAGQHGRFWQAGASATAKKKAGYLSKEKLSVITFLHSIQLKYDFTQH